MLRRIKFATFGTKSYSTLFLPENFLHDCHVNRCFKYHKYNYTLRCRKATSRILQFFCYDYFEDLWAPMTSAKNFSFLADEVSKTFAIKNALQSKNQFLRNAFGKSYLFCHLTITIARKNLIPEIGYMFYADSVFSPRTALYKFFSKDKQP